MDLDIDTLIEKLLLVTDFRLTKNVTEQELLQLCTKATAVFRSQPSLVEVNPPVVVCGDIHGQVSLLFLFSH